MTAALEVLEKDGLDNLSLRALAQTLGVSKTAPYRHFEDKQALLIALSAEGFRLFADALEASTAAEPIVEQVQDATGRDAPGARRPSRFVACSGPPISISLGLIRRFTVSCSRRWATACIRKAAGRTQHGHSAAS